MITTWKTFNDKLPHLTIRTSRRSQSFVGQRLQAACTLNLIARSQGRFDLGQVSAQLDRLASYHSARWRFQDGRALMPTIDLNSSPGAVFMVHPQSDCIHQDQLAWRTWEQCWL